VSRLPWFDGPLRQALAQPGHALLLVAPPGLGALEFQLLLAQAWLCEAEPGPARPCGRCTGCRLVAARTHPDFKLLLPGELGLARGLISEEEATNFGKRKPSRWILIDQVREALDWVVTTPGRGLTKVLLLHPAEMLQAVSANALLKTLEEPPAGARLLLSCSDAEHLLPTVRSRCQRLTLPPPTAGQSTVWLAEQGVADATALLAATAGRPLDALALHRDGIDAARWAALPEALAQGQAAAWSGWPLARALDALQKLCHDLLAAAAGAAPRYFAASGLPAPRGGIVPLLEWADELNRVARHAEHPWSEALLIDALVTQGCRALAPAAKLRA
jgi:DNA polymerase III subunit delta'